MNISDARMVNDTVYYANGKLLLTGEYVIMDGATALALPVKYGQQLHIIPNNLAVIKWEASDVHGIWFEATFSLSSFTLLSSTNDRAGNYMERLLKAASGLNPAHCIQKGCTILTSLNFDRQLGLGSSSTVIALVAKIFEVNKYKLHQLVSGGSGYDVACSDIMHPFLFTRQGNRAHIGPVNFMPPFHDQLFFVYLGNKQDTDKEISKYRTSVKRITQKVVTEISNISREVIESKEMSTFASLVAMHEEIISAVLDRPGIKNRFPGFQGVLKSLGAWGGDFILAVSHADEAYVRAFFSKYTIETIYRYSDLVLNQAISDNHGAFIEF